MHYRLSPEKQSAKRLSLVLLLTPLTMAQVGQVKCHQLLVIIPNLMSVRIRKNGKLQARKRKRTEHKTRRTKKHILTPMMILHVGTNDLKHKEPQQESIVDLARQIKNSSDATVTISELVSRRDRFNEAVKAANKHLKNYNVLPAEWMGTYPASKRLRKGIK